MKQETLATLPEENFNYIYELGKLSGEVKVLKWGAVISITMIFTYLTILSQQIDGVRASLEQQVGDVREQVGEVKEGQAVIRERLGVIEQRLSGTDHRITANGKRINTHSHL